MKTRSVLGILAAAVPLLFSTIGYANWYVSHEKTDWDKYVEYDEGEYADADYAYPSSAPYTYTWADASVEIEGEEEYKGAGAYAYVYWTDTIVDYDPEWDPPLLAHVVSEVWAQGYAEYARTVSEYSVQAVATGYANGYSTMAGVLFNEPEGGDIDTDYFDEDIDIYENGYPIYLREFAFATAGTGTTEDRVKVAAHADSDTSCVVVQNP
jgi:hypothetical protein